MMDPHIVPDALRVEAKRTGEEGGPGEVAFDGSVGVLWRARGASVPLMVWSGGEDATRSRAWAASPCQAWA